MCDGGLVMRLGWRICQDDRPHKLVNISMLRKNEVEGGTRNIGTRKYWTGLWESGQIFQIPLTVVLLLGQAAS